LLKRLEKLSPSSALAPKYFIYGIYNNNGLRKIIRNFSKKWLNKPDEKGKLKIHIEGEAYIRAAQIQDIFNSLIDNLGFNTMAINYTPVWSFFELLLELDIINCQEAVKFQQDKLKNAKNDKKNECLNSIKKAENKIKKVKKIRYALRNILAKPLYKSANIEMPHRTEQVLEKTKKILPTVKPFGELPPYIGEAILKIEEGVDLFLNLAPEGCMVSSMSQMFSKPILKLSGSNKTRIQDLFSLNGEVNEEQLNMSILKTLGPIKYYSRKK
jgi:predicted nucleotide-binding protein (sugar kinase/HSP70/actin superfamily)